MILANLCSAERIVDTKGGACALVGCIPQDHKFLYHIDFFVGYLRCICWGSRYRYKICVLQ